MNEDEVVEQTDTTEEKIEKEGAKYSQEYFEELRAAAKEYLPKTVWDHIHSKARNKAGGKASGKARAAASATAALSEPVDAPAAVEMQPPVAKVETEKQDMHPDCQKVADNCMKMKKSDEVEKVAHGKQDAPIADTGGWDGAAAQKRLLAWAGGPDKEKVNWQKFGKGFLYHDPANADNIGGYKFPVADIVNGQFKINRTALGAAAGRINQSSGIPPNELASMKSTLRGYYNDIGVDAPDNIAKEDIDTFVGSHPLITFVAASPGIIESLRKSALVGPTGRIFNEQYLKPLNLTRDDISIMYLVPRLLKDDEGKVREPTEDEIKAEWQPVHSTVPLTVALGHTVKKALGRSVSVTLPHPNALGTPRTDQELVRKREQLKKMLSRRTHNV